jgi:hypothetical protein
MTLALMLAMLFNEFFKGFDRINQNGLSKKLG